MKDVSANQSTESIPKKQSEIDALVKRCFDDSVEQQLQCCKAINAVLSLTDEHASICKIVTQMTDGGFLPRKLVFFLEHKCLELRYESIRILIGISAATHLVPLEKSNCKIVECLNNLMVSADLKLVEEAVRAVGSIANGYAKCRDIILEAGSMDILIQLHEQNSQILKKSADKDMIRHFLRTINSTMCQLVRGNPSPSVCYAKKAMYAFNSILNLHDTHLMPEACRGLAHIIENFCDGNTQIEEQAEEWESMITDMKLCGALQNLAECAANAEIKVSRPALRALGNFLTGDDCQTQEVLDVGFCDSIIMVLYHGVKKLEMNSCDRLNRSLMIEACWMISNILAGTEDQIDTIIESNIVPYLVRIIKCPHTPMAVKKQALWAIANATDGGNLLQIEYIVRQDVITHLYQMIGGKDSKSELVITGALGNILKALIEILSHIIPEESLIEAYLDLATSLNDTENLGRNKTKVKDYIDTFSIKRIELVFEAYVQYPNPTDAFILQCEYD